MIQPLYVFKWKTINGKNSNEVFTYDRNDMILFLSQHGFSTEENNNVTVVMDDVARDDINYLRIYTFGSRKRDRFYRIATTETIMSTIVMDVGAELSDAMTFGACALRGEIEIFHKIDKLIQSLDYVYIMDGYIASMNETDEYYDRYHENNGYPYYEDITKNADDSFLYDSLYNDSVPQKPVQPFTIETYVNIFTDVYIIGRSVKQHGKQTTTNNF